MWLSPRALDRLQDTFERTLVVVREENSTLRRLLEQAHARSDQLAAELARQQVLGAYGPNARLPVIAPAPERRKTSRDPIDGLGDVLAPVPFDDPRGTFKSEAEASLLFPTTEQENGNGAEA